MMHQEDFHCIEDMAAIKLTAILKQQDSLSEDQYTVVVDEVCSILNAVVDVCSPDEKKLIIKRLQTRFNTRMEIGLLFSDEKEYRPWLDDARGDTDWYYWNRYKRYLLTEKRFPLHVVASLDSITDTILDHLQNPNLEGAWRRKGLVVGHVQSGKTANYTGLISKAADAGYKVIIVLAGLLNLLRNQTQERIDAGFIGNDSSQLLSGITYADVLIGVGKLNNEHRPVSLTTSLADFDIHNVRRLNVSLDALKEPLILVIKKNVNTFDNLITWLRTHNQHLQEHPMLLVDDEADHASINTNADTNEATAINRKIRNLLHLFAKSSYLGYTATPFANIFVDPESDNDMIGDDLFPRDFILNLSPPNNYVGPGRIFSESADLNVVRSIDDYADYLPLRHNKDLNPEGLPKSLLRALQAFVIIRGIRILRGQGKAHNSMMINVTRFTDVQSRIRLLVYDYLQNLRQAITNNYAMEETEAVKNTLMGQLQKLWQDDFDDNEFSWLKIQGVLKDAVSPISVIEVNSSRNAESLDYSEKDYPNGRNVIAIGGLSLSRGLTLEGLTVSYFLRNSIMYDTLMQMGRWFGYRDGYADLCRLYMSQEAASWYAHISDVMEELREEFARMKRAGLTPKDFGLAVRNHPESLIVTARNKMRSSTRVLRQVNLEGRLIETSVLMGIENTILNNINAVESLVESVNQQNNVQEFNLGYFWEEVDLKIIKLFLSEYENHPSSQLTERIPVENYLKSWETCGIDIAFFNPRSNKSNLTHSFSQFTIGAQWRTAITGAGNSIEINRRRVASRGAEKIGMTQQDIEAAEKLYDKGTNIPDYVYRARRLRPLLMLHFLDLRDENDEQISNIGAVAWGISFPGVAGSRRPEKLVEYTVNTTWWRQHYLDLIEDEEDEEE